jgi:hypothetical protein
VNYKKATLVFPFHKAVDGLAIGRYLCLVLYIVWLFKMVTYFCNIMVTMSLGTLFDLCVYYD